MKFIINKKSSILLIVSFVSLLLIMFAFIFREEINQSIKNKPFYNLDKYSELLRDCDIERKNGTLELNCLAVLREVTDNNEDCISVEVLTDNNKGLRKSSLCTKKGTLDWEDPYEIENTLRAVKMNLSYIKKGISNYSLNGMKLSVLNDNELGALYEINSKLGKLRPEIMNKEWEGIVKNNYNVLDKEQTGDADLSHVLFYNLTLKSVTLKESNLEMLFEGEAKGQLRTLLFKSNRFFVNDRESGAYSLITPTEYSNLLEVGQTYDFLTVSSDTVLPQSIADKCTNMEESIPKQGIVKTELLTRELFMFCTVRPTKIEDMQVSNAEEYIDSAIKKAQIDTEEGIVNLEKLIPFTIAAR